MRHHLQNILLVLNEITFLSPTSYILYSFRGKCLDLQKSETMFDIQRMDWYIKVCLKIRFYYFYLHFLFSENIFFIRKSVERSKNVLVFARKRMT